MTKRPRTLTAAFVRSINRPSVYGDGRGGRGLSLRVHRTATGRITKTWRQRLRIEGRLTSVGLGPYPEIRPAVVQRLLPGFGERDPSRRGPAWARRPDVRGGRRADDRASPRRMEGREPPCPPMGVHVPSLCRAAHGQARGPDHERGRAPVPLAHLDLEARRRGGRLGAGSRRSSAGVSVGTTVRTTRWTGRSWRCRG